jgi:hypothetical protein
VPTGAVAAFKDKDSVWRHVPESGIDFHKTVLGEDVVTVWVE